MQPTLVGVNWGFQIVQLEFNEDIPQEFSHVIG
jgi:hypothetical protein